MHDNKEKTSIMPGPWPGFQEWVQYHIDTADNSIVDSMWVYLMVEANLWMNRILKHSHIPFTWQNVEPLLICDDTLHVHLDLKVNGTRMVAMNSTLMGMIDLDTNSDSDTPEAKVVHQQYTDKLGALCQLYHQHHNRGHIVWRIHITDRGMHAILISHPLDLRNNDNVLFLLFCTLYMEGDQAYVNCVTHRTSYGYRVSQKFRAKADQDGDQYRDLHPRKALPECEHDRVIRRQYTYMPTIQNPSVCLGIQTALVPMLNMRTDHPLPVHHVCVQHVRFMEGLVRNLADAYAQSDPHISFILERLCAEVDPDGMRDNWLRFACTPHERYKCLMSNAYLQYEELAYVIVEGMIRLWFTATGATNPDRAHVVWPKQRQGHIIRRTDSPKPLPSTQDADLLRAFRMNVHAT